jgi:hypothetical protein
MPVSQAMVETLFDGAKIAPGAGNDLFVGGGGYDGQQAGAADQTVYGPGGITGTLAEVQAIVRAAGPGRLQVGGKRKSRRYKSRKSRKSRRRKGRRSA